MEDRVKPPFADVATMGARRGGKTFAQQLAAQALSDSADVQLAAWRRLMQDKGGTVQVSVDPAKLNTATLVHVDPAGKRQVRHIGIDEAARLDRDLVNAVLYSQSASRTHRPAPEKTLNSYSDAELVMHMLGRGYAVMKLPKDGGPPETLRDG